MAGIFLNGIITLESSVGSGNFETTRGGGEWSVRVQFVYYKNQVIKNPPISSPSSWFETTIFRISASFVHLSALNVSPLKWVPRFTPRLDQIVSTCKMKIRNISQLPPVYILQAVKNSLFVCCRGHFAIKFKVLCCAHMHCFSVST